VGHLEGTAGRKNKVKNQKIEIAIDIGSTGIKAAAVDEKRQVVLRLCHPGRGQLKGCLISVLRSLALHFKNKSDRCFIGAVTGSNSTFYGDRLDLKPVNAVLAAYLGVKRLVPQAGAILEIGGCHANFIRLSSQTQTHIQAQTRGEKILEDFYMNSRCSAGMGSFLEQEAHRLNLTLDDFSRLACEPAHYVPVAGRCAVFSKTDIIHHHQNGVPLPDIAYSLCRAIARNISDELVCNRTFVPPLVFIGGVAANKGIRRALQEILNLNDESLLVPEDYLYAAAIGSLMFSNPGKEETQSQNVLCLHEAIERIENSREYKREAAGLLKPLHPCHSSSHPSLRWDGEKKQEPGRMPGDTVIGIDIGSTTTNIACLDDSGEIIEDITLPTRGQALRAVYEGLSLLRDKYGVFFPRAVGVTGSGRKFVAEITGADSTLNEITAHSLGAVHFYPGTDTIFDIGGQDSKFIRVENGSVVNFEMNKVCAAGTGSFLEETAQLLDLDIKNQFAAEAMASKSPVDLGERCTVFISSQLTQKLQEGYSRQDLAAGLCYSVVKNYLSKIVGRNKIGKWITFQGGVAGNQAVAAALENHLQTPIHVHRYHDMAGAVGVALYAMHQVKTHKRKKTRFRGFRHLDINAIKTRAFECKKCSNYCGIHFTTTESGNRFFSGGLCARYEEQLSPQKSRKNENSTDEHEPFVLRDMALAKHIKKWNPSGVTNVIGIPRALSFYDLMPFWSTFFNHLGVIYTFSEPTSKETIREGISNCPSNPCLPVKIAYGHCKELIDKGIKKIFLPCISNMSFLTKQERLNHMCPALQAWPFTTRSIFHRANGTIEFITPTIRFAIPHLLETDILRLGKSLGYSKKNTLNALKKALNAQNEFYTSMQQMGKELFSNLQDQEENRFFVVIISRPYTVFDRQVSLRLKKIFKELDITAIPMDMVPVNSMHSKELHGMYWYYGKRFLQAALALNKHRNIAVIHLSTFGCGADSFIIHFLRQKLIDMPVLELEIDEHNEFTGIATRVEAFLHSLPDNHFFRAKTASPPRHVPVKPLNLKETELLIPRMSDHAFAVSAAFRSCGVNARVLPLPDEESTALGKQSVDGPECLPCPLVMGDMLKYLKYNRDKARQVAFFMISGDGPCRLGQYPYLQRLVLDKQGFKDIPIFNASQDPEFYQRFGIVPASFQRKAWQGVVAIDFLFRKWRETRPYTCKKHKKTIDKIYYEEIENLCNCIRDNARSRKNGKLPLQLRHAFSRLEEAKTSSSNSRPIIAVLGENYVRCNSFANGKIAEALEDLGAETWFPSIFEWVYYTNWTARLHCLYERQYKKYVKLFLVDAVQHWDELRLRRAIKGQLRNLHEPPVSKILHMASGCVPHTFEGETVIEIGRTIDFFNKNVDGVLHVIPFGCIMGTIVETLSEGLSQHLGGFPVLTIPYDGQAHQLPGGKLEGFMLRARLWKARRGDTPKSVHRKENLQ